MKAVAAEYLRQQREAFDQNKAQAAQWFALRLRMAYAGMALTILVGGACGAIIVWHQHFPDSAVAAAVAGLSVDVFGMLAAVWKIVLAPGSVLSLAPRMSSIDEVTRSGPCGGQ